MLVASKPFAFELISHFNRMSYSETELSHFCWLFVLLPTVGVVQENERILQFDISDPPRLVAIPECVLFHSVESQPLRHLFRILNSRNLHTETFIELFQTWFIQKYIMAGPQYVLFYSVNFRYSALFFKSSISEVLSTQVFTELL